ncbi:hypothetical protein AMECASPLE_037678 [Ameca splendens]|uniref:Uncharacterized protein n=1 Tax=Ameca splendens TaxID=208324 RepID=A0ABV0XWU4_9TELE
MALDLEEMALVLAASHFASNSKEETLESTKHIWNGQTSSNAPFRNSARSDPLFHSKDDSHRNPPKYDSQLDHLLEPFLQHSRVDLPRKANKCDPSVIGTKFQVPCFKDWDHQLCHCTSWYQHASS